MVLAVGPQLDAVRRAGDRLGGENQPRFLLRARAPGAALLFDDPGQRLNDRRHIVDLGRQRQKPGAVAQARAVIGRDTRLCRARSGSDRRPP